VSLLAEVEARLDDTRAHLNAALAAAAAYQQVDLAGLTDLVDGLCRDIVRLPPAQGRPKAEALALLIQALDELERRLRLTEAKASGRLDTVHGRAARAYGRPPGA
jgi:hypothetical protein